MRNLHNNFLSFFFFYLSCFIFSFPLCRFSNQKKLSKRQFLFCFITALEKEKETGKYSVAFKTSWRFQYRLENMHLNNSANQSNILNEITKPKGNDGSRIYHVFYISIAVTAFLANFTLCLLHACCKRLRRSINVFLTTHYVANTLQTLTTMVFFSSPSNDNALVCLLNIFFSCSVLCIPVISVVTLFKTQWVNRCPSYLSGSRQSYVLVVIILLIGVGVAVAPFLGWGSPILMSENPLSTSISYAVFAGCCLSFGPLIIIFFTNYKLFSRVRMYERRARKETRPHCLGVGRMKCEPRRREGDAKWVTILQIIAFVICIVPIFVENILATVVPHKMPEALRSLFTCLAQAYCAMSAILHGLTNREVRLAFKCCCYQKTFVIQGHPRKRRKREKMGEGCYRMGTKDGPFIIHPADQSCDELEGANDLDYARRERLVRFTGVSTEFSTNAAIDDVPLPQKAIVKEKRPITAEFAPIRRHSTLRKQDEEASRTRRKYVESTKVRFESEYTDKQRKKYIATPSIKRMRQIKNSMSNMTETDFQSSLASLCGYEFETQQHKAPHFTNYSDPMRSEGFRQVLTSKAKRTRTNSLDRSAKYKPTTRAFMEKRFSTDSDKAIRNGNNM